MTNPSTWATSRTTARRSSVSGNLFPADRSVYYTFRGVDQADTSCDNYHVDIRFSDNPDGQFIFQAVRGSCANFPAADVDWYYSYDWYTDLRQTIMGTLTGECPCAASVGEPPPNMSRCQDNTDDFFVRVFRDPALPPPTSCVGYTLEITNGVYDAI